MIKNIEKFNGAVIIWKLTFLKLNYKTLNLLIYTLLFHSVNKFNAKAVYVYIMAIDIWLAVAYVLHVVLMFYKKQVWSVCFALTYRHLRSVVSIYAIIESEMINISLSDNCITVSNTPTAYSKLNHFHLW